MPGPRDRSPRDGSNAIEDNGPGAIVAISQYLDRLPRTALPRTIMILLTTATSPAATGHGQAEVLFARGGIATSNYITGPTYLLNWGIKTTDKVNHDRVRAEAIAFTEMILRLGRTPRASLQAYTL